MFVSSLGPVTSPEEGLISVLFVGIGQGIADALMIWRCWQALTGRRNRKLLLFAFYIGEIVLLLVGFAIAGLVWFDPRYKTAQFARRYNILQGSTFLVTAMTSMMATFVIGAQIYVSTRQNLRARKRYAHIVEIMIQSAALYSLTILGQAIIALTTSGNLATLTSAILNGEFYTSGLMVFTTAFAPTLMVARISIERSKVWEAHSPMHTMSQTEEHTMPPDDAGEIQAEDVHR
ncbi:hypothetical protein D9613_010637 [Agrocybe pediades]|uniref:Uncharacterized protein n=1 Tax=Agrocybe pediades TaxID=84607 RepID=A0A8H4QG84_9AGAR|nr:hypothetical protein D9613_010637 [Agrocybe pediades]